MTRKQLLAAEITRLFWDSRRAEMTKWLVTAKGFNPKGAPKAVNSFIGFPDYRVDFQHIHSYSASD